MADEEPPANFPIPELLPTAVPLEASATSQPEALTPATQEESQPSSLSSKAAPNLKIENPEETTATESATEKKNPNPRKRRKSSSNDKTDSDSKSKEQFSSQNEWASTFFKWNGERNRFLCDAPIKVNTTDSDSSVTEVKCKHSGFEAGTKRSNMVVHLQKVHAMDMPDYLQERCRGSGMKTTPVRGTIVVSKAKQESGTKTATSATTTTMHDGTQAHPDTNNIMPNRNNPCFEVNVCKQDFKFHAAHFVAYQGYRERLHGHNYSVGVKLRGSNTIGNDGYVIDYGVVKKVTRKICKELNEHFLCPMLSDVITITKVVNPDNKKASNIKLSCEDGTMFQFPLSDCALLPIVHATTEELAIYLWGRILKDLDPVMLLQRGIYNLEVTITEAVGQESVFSMNIPNAFNKNYSRDCEEHCCNEEYNPGLYCVKDYIRGLRPCGCHSLHD